MEIEIHMKKKSSKFQFQRWEDVFEEHMGIFKHEVFEVTFLFVSFTLFLLFFFSAHSGDLKPVCAAKWH